MDICITIPCLLNGGTERQTLMLSTALGSLGHAVTVLCYFEFDPEIVSEFEKAGAVVSLLALNRKSNFVKIISRLKEEIRSIKPDVVHVQYMAPGALPIVAARLAGVKKIFATVHQPYTLSHGKISRVILRIVAHLTTKFISVSQNAEKSWFGTSTLFDSSKSLKSQPKHFTIHNGIDTDRINAIISRANVNTLRNELNIGDDIPLIGALSRIRHEKGIDLLVEAFYQLVQEGVRAQLLIVGSGQDEDNLKDKIKEWRIGSSVRFYGRANWDEAMQLMSLMDIVVVPSRFEGFGLSAAEAMAAGKPVIASDTSGLSEIVSDNETGILFPVENIGALKDAMMRLLKDKQLRYNLGRAGKKKIEGNFSLEIFRERIKALYSF